MPTHEHSDKITIKYSFQNAWSINKSKKNVIQAGVQRNSLDVFADAVITEFRDQEFIWIANNAAVSVLRSKFGDNQNISSVSHGMNNHVNTHNVAFMAALNPSPAHQRFLQSIGMTDEKIKNAKVHQNIYQAVMRTSIRNPDSTSDKTIIVPDLGSALYMQMKIPGAEIQQLDGGIEESNLVRGSKPLGDKPMTAAERQRKRRAKIKAAKSAA